MPAPTSTRPEEREFVVDSGASMHMMSKKELSSEEMDTLRRSTPTVVLTAIGRSANPRGGTSARSRPQSVRNRATTGGNASSPVARQALRKPRILWVGQRSKATIDPKWKEYNFVPLVVPGLSFISGSVSSSTSPSQDSLRREVETAIGSRKRSASSSSSGSVSERSCGRHPETGASKKKSGDPLADLPEWLEEFKENLVDTELLASTHTSQESDSEHPTKVETKSRKRSIYTYLPKDRDCAVCFRT